CRAGPCFVSDTRRFEQHVLPVALDGSRRNATEHGRGVVPSRQLDQLVDRGLAPLTTTDRMMDLAVGEPQYSSPLAPIDPEHERTVTQAQNLQQVRHAELCQAAT